MRQFENGNSFINLKSDFINSPFGLIISRKDAKPAKKNLCEAHVSMLLCGSKKILLILFYVSIFTSCESEKSKEKIEAYHVAISKEFFFSLMKEILEKVLKL